MKAKIQKNAEEMTQLRVEKIKKMLLLPLQLMTLMIVKLQMEHITTSA